jgi:hypothetical protein
MVDVIVAKFVVDNTPCRHVTQNVLTTCGIVLNLIILDRLESTHKQSTGGFSCFQLLVFCFTFAMRWLLDVVNGVVVRKYNKWTTHSVGLLDCFSNVSWLLIYMLVAPDKVFTVWLLVCTIFGIYDLWYDHHSRLLSFLIQNTWIAYVCYCVLYCSHMI